MNEQSDFLRFVGQLVFSPENNTWDALSPAKQEEFCQLAHSTKLQGLFARYLDKRLPEAFHETFRQAYFTDSMMRLIEIPALNELYQMLETANISFVPIKGADLAFRVYPDQALRSHGDWDILFHKSDCPAVLKMLADRSWQTFSGNAGEHIICWDQHYERMHNSRNVIEVHHSLPNLNSVPEDEIWRETREITAHRRCLSPEASLLLLYAHASGNEFRHVSPCRLLCDAGFIIKHNPIDWDKLHSLAARWGIVPPDLMLSVWKEFFPAGTLPSHIGEEAEELKEAFRTIFKMGEQIAQVSNYDRKTVPGTDGALLWLKDRLVFYLHPSRICKKYNLKQYQFVRIFAYGLWDFVSKIYYFCAHRHSKTCNDVRTFRDATLLVKKISEKKAK